MLQAATSLLLLIDFQARLMPAIEGGAAAAKTARRLAQAAQCLGVSVRATEQNPAGLGGTIAELSDLGVRTIAKSHFDATREPGFGGLLDPDRPQIVVAGCEAHVCVLQTCLGLRRDGHAVSVVADAVGSRRADDRKAGLERLARHGCEIITSEMALFEWLGTAEHPKFRTVLALIK